LHGLSFSPAVYQESHSGQIHSSCHLRTLPHPFTAEGPIIVTWSVGDPPSYAPAGLVYADVKPAILLAGFGGAFGRSATAY